MYRPLSPTPLSRTKAILPVNSPAGASTSRRLTGRRSLVGSQPTADEPKGQDRDQDTGGTCAHEAFIGPAPLRSSDPS